jgi:tRNA-binding protein
LPRHIWYFYRMETDATPAPISIDDFRKIELKVATVIAAEAHPNADKLMVLQVDLGSERRQICAGIKAHYAPADLIGKQIVVVANLATAKLRGLESQGMLLAASSDGQVIVLTPEKPVQPGSQVK